MRNLLSVIYLVGSMSKKKVVEVKTSEPLQFYDF